MVSVYVHDRVDQNERFRERRRRARRRIRRRRAVALAILLGVVAGIALGATLITHSSAVRSIGWKVRSRAARA